MKSAELTVTYSLDIECPYCGAELDLCDQDDDGYFTIPIFNNSWDELLGEEAVCSGCHKDFEISEVVN